MQIFKDFKDIGTKNNGLRFSLKVSNGKNKTTGEWKNQRLPTTRLLAKQLKKKEYQTKDEIFVMAKYYQKEHEVRYYKGFVTKQVIQNRGSAKNTQMMQNYAL